MQERLEYIDRIKGFAILLVVIGHVYIFSFGVTDTLVYKVIASFHMPLFMFISGFVSYIKPNSENIKRKILNRFFSYLIPTFAVGGLVFAYINLFDIDILYYWDPYYGYWYLKSLAIFCGIQLLILKCKRVWVEMLLILVILSLFYFGWRYSPLLTQILCLEHNVCFYPFFLCGYYTRRFNVMDILTQNNRLYTLAFLGYLIFSVANFPSDLITEVCQRYLAPLMAIVAIVYYFYNGRTIPGLSRCLCYLGTKTLDIYLFHFFFIINFNIINLSGIWERLCVTENTFCGLLLSVVVSVVIIYVSIFVGDFLRTSCLLRRFVYGQIMQK